MVLALHEDIIQPVLASMLLDPSVWNLEDRLVLPVLITEIWFNQI